MNQNQNMKYTGKVQPQPGEKDTSERPLFPYLPNEELIEAVNLAIQLERPLLLKGEPGCGKTRLAYAVAYELGLPFQPWYIKSTSRAKDGLYTYDTIGRLRDAQLVAGRMIKEEDIARISNPASYVQWGAIGKAFKNKKRTVILIDEIDKADIDFPNDLLLELDESRFLVEETSEIVQAKEKPIVFITSNDEKDLPDAFLRRCLFHYVEFPDYERLVEIIQQFFPITSQTLAQKAVERFQQLREEMHKDKGYSGKKVSTSELIDWFNILQSHPEDEALKKLEGKLPYPGVLLKSYDDHRRYLARMGGKDKG
ncbi:AAA family ATPase [Anabaena azotica]|uniref:AAA family ATPase n=1 Tax=Anabaena azotica TaxID=197653 RepID=UPI0039A41B2F